ncbi:MAG: AIPR family protein [Balneola sp.]
MKDIDFYNIIDNEIDHIIKEYKSSSILAKKDISGKKSFCFLIWFLRKYIPSQDVIDLDQYIVDGHDDSSCDLIFYNFDSYGNKVFYVVQAKWFDRSNISKTNKMSKDLKACLTDFRVIRNGSKEPSIVNKKFNLMYEEFLKHKKDNGKIKFIFLHLCQKIEGVKEQIDDFTTKLVSFQTLDIFELKKHYVEFNYKGIKTHNPLETPYEPKTEIELKVIKNSNIEIPKPAPFESYIVLLRPSQIFDLFDKYGLSIFYKNIRNPLPKSFYNEKIVQTILDNPLNFWYFNNGITAITDEIQDFDRDAEKIKIRGIQIINGAQTVYSIYQSILNANDSDVEKIDKDSFVTLRLMRTGGEDFDLLVTRFTNSQNPIDERDFHANDYVQKRLQHDFLKNTNIWYETRRGEFRKRTNKAKVVSNLYFAQSYLIYHLQNPFIAKTKRRFLFVSQKEDNNGLYEEIFNENTRWNDLLISRLLFQYVDSKRKEYSKKIKSLLPRDGVYSSDQKELIAYNFIQYSTFEIVAIFKPLLERANGPSNSKQFQGKLISQLDENNRSILDKYYEIITDKIKLIIQKKKIEDLAFTDSVYFKNRKTYLELQDFVINNIDKDELTELNFTDK